MAVIIRRWETDNRRHGEPMPAVIIRREVAPLARHGCYYQTLPLEQPRAEPRKVEPHMPHSAGRLSVVGLAYQLCGLGVLVGL